MDFMDYDPCEQYEYFGTDEELSACVRTLSHNKQSFEDIWSYIMSPLGKVLKFLWNTILDPILSFIISFAKNHTLLFILSIVAIFLCIAFIEELRIKNKKFDNYIKNIHDKYAEIILTCFSLLILICFLWGIVAVLIAAIITYPLNAICLIVIFLLAKHT